ncbi:hypothetical protein [Helicobacter cappadocius]|uniref:Uncharacterized protein n=1 Tax=Helicobacter cappadocius TaxID=3063998 RepID=A0AA90PKD5_9HELI|nr:MULTISPECIES: hypothetical protein [unclassified Helicobacter]MDO7253110.1 hypothetical protein [Helicobacter sp. faydin-H75]MDP2538764.1 hypothetical protein [Helicobacter sp. faydin-H76]
MNKINMYKVVFSSIFFLLFVFSILSLLVSQFSSIFSQLFLILTRDERAYDSIINFFYFCGILMSIFYLVVSTLWDKDVLLQRLVSVIFCIGFVFLLVFRLSSEKTLDSTILGFVADSSFERLGFGQLVAENFGSIILSGFIYVFFVILPLVFFGFGYGLNTKNIFGKYLDFFCPSMNVCVIALFASGFQAYYDKSSAFLYIDFMVFCLCLVLFLRVFLTHKELFGHYEYANILLMILGILICLLCSNTISQAQDYYNARKSFYLLVFLGWYGEWMYKSLLREFYLK